jgi:glycosyltransferase involved in cell wall biosynthesis
MKVAFLTTDNREHGKDYGAPAPYFGTAPAALLSGFARLPELEVHVISCTRRPMQSPARLAPNIFFHSLHVGKMGWMRTAYLGCIRAVRRKLRELRPVLAHGQGTERDCALSAVFSGLPNVVTIHGNMRRIAGVMRAGPFSFFWLAARLESLTVARTGGVVCITRHTQREVAGSSRRNWLIPNSVDESFFDVNADPGGEVPPRVLCVGQVYALKNQNALIRALDPVAERCRFELVFLGDARAGQPYAEEFRKLVAARPWCRHAGFAGRKEMRDYLRGASLLVQPTLEDNCPMAVLEAMAAGVPVLASKVGGLPDLIEEGRTGLFCDPAQPATMADSFERLVQSPELRRELGGNARQWAARRFHPLVIAKRHVEVYAELLGREVSAL